MVQAECVPGGAWWAGDEGQTTDYRGQKGISGTSRVLEEAWVKGGGGWNPIVPPAGPWYLSGVRLPRLSPLVLLLARDESLLCNLVL